MAFPSELLTYFINDRTSEDYRSANHLSMWFLFIGEDGKGHINKLKQTCADLKIPLIGVFSSSWKGNCHNCTVCLKLEMLEILVWFIAVTGSQ